MGPQFLRKLCKKIKLLDHLMHLDLDMEWVISSEEFLVEQEMKTLGAFQTGPAVPQIASAVPDAVSLLEKENKGMLVYLGGGRLVPVVYRTKKVAMPNKETETLVQVWVVSNQDGISLVGVIGIQIAAQSNATYSAIAPIIANHLRKMEYLVDEKQDKYEEDAFKMVLNVVLEMIIAAMRSQLVMLFPMDLKMEIFYME